MSQEWRSESLRLPPRWERPGIQRTTFEFLRVLNYDALWALTELLMREDEPDLRGTVPGADGLCRRGRIVTYDGAPERFRKWLTVRVRAIRARELTQLVLADGAIEEEK